MNPTPARNAQKGPYAPRSAPAPRPRPRSGRVGRFKGLLNAVTVAPRPFHAGPCQGTGFRPQSRPLRRGFFRMAGRPAPKRLYYMRCKQPHAQCTTTLQARLVHALNALGTQGETEVVVPRHGRMCVFSRRVTDRVLLAVGGANPREGMRTLTFGHSAAEEVPSLAPPPENTGYMHAAFYMLVMGNEVVLCMDHTRVPTVQEYLTGFLLASGIPSQHAVTTLEHRIDEDVAAVLARDGIKSVRVEGTIHKATLDLHALADDTTHPIRRALGEMSNLLRSRARTPQQEQQAAEAYAGISVAVEIDTKGRQDLSSVGYQAVATMATDMLDFDTSETGIDILLTTRRNPVPIRASQVQISKGYNFRRVENGNDLPTEDVYTALGDYQRFLVSEGDWGS